MAFLENILQVLGYQRRFGVFGAFGVLVELCDDTVIFSANVPFFLAASYIFFHLDVPALFPLLSLSGIPH